MSALIAWPITSTATSLNLRLLVNGGTQNASVSLTAGRYYWTVGDGQADASTNDGVGDLLGILQAAIRATTAAAAGVTVALTTDFRVRIRTNSLDTIDLQWSNAATTLPESWFGFTNTDTGAGVSHTGTLLPQGLWRPRKPVSEPDTRDRQVLVAGVSRTMTGRIRVANFGTASRERSLSFRLLNRNVALDEYVQASEPYGSFEHAWINSIGVGRPFRLYEDETALTSSDYTLYSTISVEDPLDRDPSSRLRWAVDLQAARY